MKKIKYINSYALFLLLIITVFQLCDRIQFAIKRLYGIFPQI